MTAELQKLVALYSALQECAPSEQASCQKAFRVEVTATAARHKLDHWRVAAHVVKQWEITVQKDEKRKGLDKGPGLAIEDSDAGGKI